MKSFFATAGGLISNFCQLGQGARITGLGLLYGLLMASTASAHPEAYGPDGRIPHAHTKDGTVISGSSVAAQAQTACPPLGLTTSPAARQTGLCIRLDRGVPVSAHSLRHQAQGQHQGHHHGHLHGHQHGHHHGHLSGHLPVQGATADGALSRALVPANPRPVLVPSWQPSRLHQPVARPVAVVQRVPVVQQVPVVRQVNVVRQVKVVHHVPVVRQVPVVQPVKVVSHVPMVRHVPVVRHVPSRQFAHQPVSVVRPVVPTVVAPVVPAPAPRSVKILPPPGRSLVTEFDYEGETLSVINTGLGGQVGIMLIKIVDASGATRGSWWTTNGRCYTPEAYQAQSCWSEAVYAKRFKAKLEPVSVSIGGGSGPQRSTDPCDHYSKLEAIISEDTSGYCGY